MRRLRAGALALFLLLLLLLVLRFFQTLTLPVAAAPDLDHLTTAEFMEQFKATVGGRHSNTFVPLTDSAVVDHFTALLEALLSHDVSAAQREIEALDALGIRYRLFQLDDMVNGPALGFMERVLPGTPDYRGWGAVLLRPAAAGSRVYQAPHVKADAYSEDIAWRAFREDAGAPVVLFAGTHRYAGTRVSYSWVSGTYDGQPGVAPDWVGRGNGLGEAFGAGFLNWVYPRAGTETLGGQDDSGSAWTGLDANPAGPTSDSISDVAHHTQNLFHALTEYLARRGQANGDPYWFIQIHGSRDRSREPTIVGSNGADRPRLTSDDPLVRIDAAVDFAGHVDMGVCGWREGHSDDEDGRYYLCATTNVQGDLLQSLGLRQRFVHLEIERHARDDYRAGRGAGYDGILSLLAGIRSALH